MACVPPRAGFESARKFPIGRGVPLSHCKMKQLLLARSSMWHRTCRGWPPVLTVRNMVSQAVVVEEIEAIEASEASEKKAVHRQRWQAHETMALIAAKKQQGLMGMDSTEAAGIENKKTKNKWKEVEAFCRERGVERSAQQCQTRWSRLLSAFTQIQSWEVTRRPEQPSFWSLKLDERKTMGFLGSLDQKTYNALDEFLTTKADAKENVFVNNNVVEVAELGSINRMAHEDDGKKYNANEADVNFGCVQGKSDEIKNMTNSHSSSYKSDEMVQTKGLNIKKPNAVESSKRDIIDADDNFHLEELEECSRENHVDQCKAMENTNILSEFLQLAMDDRNDGQQPLVSTEKIDLKPTVLPTGQQVEEVKVPGIADHSDSLILCDPEDVNVKAQLLPASAEMIGDSNEESYKMPLVDDHNKAQRLHASAGNMDFNPSNLHTGQLTEPLKYSGKDEHIISKSRCDQRDAYDETEFLPASAEMMDDSAKDSCKGSLKEHGAEEKPIVMHGDDDNVSLSGVMYDEIAQAAQDKHSEKGAAGILFKTNASVIDSLAKEGIASVAASVEEPCECQKSGSHLSSPGVDVLNANESTQTIPLSYISADSEPCNEIQSDHQKDMDSEPCNEMQSDHLKDGNDAFERPKVATKEGDWVVGIGVSTVDTNPPAHTSIDHGVQHVPEHESTIKGDAESLESASEASRVEVAANQVTKLEFIVKDDRGTPVTAEKGSIKDGSQKTSARSPADEDVFTNIPAATGSLVKSALQTIRNFFKF